MVRGYHQIEHGISNNEEYKARITTLKEMGVEGIVVNHPFTAQYLKDPQGWKMLNDAIDFAKDCNMDVWIYDEKGYPSGGAWTYVIDKNVDYQAQGIVCLEKKVKVGDSLEYVLPDDLENIVSCYAVQGEVTHPIKFQQNRFVYSADADTTVYVIAKMILHNGTAAQGNGYEDRPYVNIMDKEAIRCFIEITYGVYFKNIPDLAEKIDAFFTDEPCLIEGYIIPNREYKYAPVSWVDGFEKEFQKKYGYDILTCAHRLFIGEDCQSKLTRIHYRELVAELVGAAYFGQINAYCKEHGTVLSGHINNEEFIHEHVAYYGNLYTTFDKTGYLGMDCLNGSIEAFMDYRFIGSKFIGSLARIRGMSETVMVELCPFQDKTRTTDEGIKAVTSMLYFMGANYLNSYARAENMGNPNEYCEYIHFLSDMLEDSVNATDIAVFYPVETVQAKYIPIKGTHWEHYRKNTTEIGWMEDEIRKLAKDIWKNKLDFEFIDSKAILESECKDGKLNIHGLKFKYIIMPYVEWIPTEVVDKLSKFESRGGKVIWLSSGKQVHKYSGTDSEIVHVPIFTNPVLQEWLMELKPHICFEGDENLIYGEFAKKGIIYGMMVNNSMEQKAVTFSNEIQWITRNDEAWQDGKSCVVPSKEAIFIKKAT